MAENIKKPGADKQSTSPLNYNQELTWRLLAEVPWLAVTLVLAVIMLIRLILVSSGTFGLDYLFRSTLPITITMGFLLIPMVIIVASGDADLSLGFLAGLVSWMLAILSPKLGLGAAIAISLLVSLLVGSINGLLVGLFKLKGIIVTFAMSFLLSGLILVLGGGKVIQGPAELTPALARSPIMILLWLLLVIVCAALMKFTPLGRRPIAGDPVQETLGMRLLYRGLPFVFSGVMAWISGILILGWVGYATIASGVGWAEMVLLATLLGGTAYAAGTGFLLSGAIALFAIVLFQNGNQMANLEAADQKLIQGVLLLLMLPIAHFYHVGIDGLYRRRKKII